MTIATGQVITATDVLAALALQLPLAGGTLNGPLVLAADPATPLGAATKQYIDAINTTLTNALASVVPAGALLKSGGTMTGPIVLAADPAAALQAATKQYVDAAVAVVASAAAAAQTTAGTALPKAGGTMTGPIVLSADPAAPLQAATRQYVDAINTALSASLAAIQTTANAALPRSGGTMAGALVLAADPASALQAATRQYVDAAVAAVTSAASAAQATATAALARTGGTMTGPIVLAADPAAPLGAATKQYVDAAGLSVSNVYTVSGPIASTDAFAILEPQTAITMTLAAGSDGHSIRINNTGPANATVTGTFQLAPGLSYVLAPGNVLALSYSTVVSVPSWLLTSTMAGGTQASNITVDTPPQTLPNTAFAVTGTLQGAPLSLQYQIDAGSWVAATGATITPNASFVFTIAGGIAAAGGHTISVRDTNSPAVLGTSGTLAISAFNPATVSTGTALWVFDANDRSLVNANAATGAITTVVNRLHNTQALTAVLGASNVPILWQRGLGNDGARRLVKLSPSIQPGGTPDPGTNFFTAGGLGGSSAALVTAVNLPSGATVGSWTIGWAGYCDFTSNPSYQYWSGPIWINLPLFSGSNQWVQIRWNKGAGNVNGQISDLAGTNSNASVATPTSGYYVWTLVKNAATLTLRANGAVAGTFSITSVSTFAAADFMFGGGGNAAGSLEIGTPPTSWGSMQVYSGALSGVDLTGMEQMLGNSVGMIVTSGGTTFATAITVDTPPQTLPSTTFTVTGTVAGTPAALQYQINAGTWTTAPSPTIVANTSFSFSVAGGLSAGTYTIGVRDANATTVSGVSGNMVVAAFNPATVSTGTLVWAFDPNDPAQVGLGASGAVLTISSKNAPAKFLNAISATNGVTVQWVRGQGADGARRLLKMSASTQDSGTYDPSTNWFSAGGLSGSANTLIQALNVSNIQTLNCTICFAVYMDTTGTYTYALGPAWGQVTTPGPLQRFWPNRYASFSSSVNSIIQTADGTGTTATSAAPTSGWYVATYLQSGTSMVERINGVQTGTATLATSSGFTALDFTLGGGFSVGNTENGLPYPYYGAFQVYTGTLSGADLTGMEKMIGNSAGLVI